MKKISKKIIVCLLIIGVLLFSTPFLIKTKADNDENTINLDINEYWHLTSFIDNDIITIRLFSYDDYYIEDSTIVVLINNYPSLSFNDGTNTMIEYGDFLLIWDNSLQWYEGHYDISDILENEYVAYINFLFSSRVSYYQNMTFTIGYYRNINAQLYAEGYQAGQRDTIINTNPTSIISKFGEGVNDILSIPIFGQITLGTLVFIPLSMAVVLILLKIWRRN